MIPLVGVRTYADTTPNSSEKLRQITLKVTLVLAGPAPESGTGEPLALTPAQARLRKMVLDAVPSPHSKRNYAKALDDLFAFCASQPLSRSLLYFTNIADTTTQQNQYFVDDPKPEVEP